MIRFSFAILLVVVLLTANILIGCGPAEGTAEWHLNQGNKFFDEGHYVEAIEACNEDIRLNPEYVRAFTNRGYNYYKLG
ncbi:tetratricopeptide repeat protein [Chloroflexota bacterium]